MQSLLALPGNTALAPALKRPLLQRSKYFHGGLLAAIYHGGWLLPWRSTCENSACHQTSEINTSEMAYMALRRNVLRHYELHQKVKAQKRLKIGCIVKANESCGW